MAFGPLQAAGAAFPLTFGASALSGMFGGGGPDFSRINDLISQRQAQIDDFAQKLDTSRNNLLANQQSLAKNTMGFLLPAIQAKLGAQGLSPNGGALNSAIAAAAVPYMNQYNMMNTELTQRNLEEVNNARSNLFGNTLQAYGQESMIPYQARQNMTSGLLSAGTSIFGNALMANAMRSRQPQQISALGGE